MATPYVAAVDGEWDASVTNTWGQGLGVYPDTAGDVVTIGAGKTVTYNKVSTVELGAITVAGLLTFSTAMSTKLTLGHVDLAVSNGGELRVGASGAIIPAARLAELIWNTTADNAKGVNLADGGKLTVYGDPTYYGSDYDTTLSADGTNSAGDAGAAGFIVTANDMSAKWQIGQQLAIHKGAAWANTTTDWLAGVGGINLPTIVSFGAANKINLDVLVPTTFKSGADVLNLSRNVKFYKLAYVQTPSSGVSTVPNRPKVANSNVYGTSNVNISDALFGGFYQVLIGYGVSFNGVCKQCCYPANGQIGGTVNGILIFNYVSLQSIRNATIDGYFCGSGLGMGGANNVIVGPNNVTGKFFGNTTAIGQIMGNTNIYAYSNQYGYFVMEAKILGTSGYNAAGNALANTYDFYYYVYNMKLQAVNVKMPASPTFYYRNTIGDNGRICFEHYQQVTDAHYIADCWGDIYKVAADGSGDNPSLRAGGGADILEVVPQSNVTSTYYVEIFNVRLWAEAGVSKTYRFYVQTDFATLPTAELKLYGEYLDAVSGGHLATVSSTQDITTRANAADWSQYVEVTINPAQDGFINLYMWLMGYEAAKKVWVDPMAEITDGSTRPVTVRWSYGEVVLDIDPVAIHGIL